MKHKNHTSTRSRWNAIDERMMSKQDGRWSGGGDRTIEETRSGRFAPLPERERERERKNGHSRVILCYHQQQKQRWLASVVRDGVKGVAAAGGAE